jgi:enoyl-CoA hydratase
MSVRVEDAEGVRTILMARPPVNALDLPAIEDLRAAFLESAGVKAVVLSGEGSAFSAGVDVRAFSGYDAAMRRELALAITRMTSAILSLPVPLVAAVNGHALGGGFVLMLCADWRIASTDAPLRLGMPEAQAGVPFPAGPAEIIRHELPAPLLRALALSSMTMDQQALHDAGVIDGLVPADSLRAAACAAALRLASQPAFAVVKRQVRGGLAARVAALAEAGADPFLDAFG